MDTYVKEYVKSNDRSTLGFKLDLADPDASFRPPTTSALNFSIAKKQPLTVRFTSILKDVESFLGDLPPQLSKLVHKPGYICLELFPNLERSQRS